MLLTELIIVIPDSLNHGFTDAIGKWLDGKHLDPDTDYLYGLPVVWLNRSASLLQFIGGLTILAEILGQNNIRTYESRLEKYIDLKKTIRNIPLNIAKLWFYLVSIFADDPTDKLNQRIRRNKRHSPDKSDYLAHRKDIAKWREDFPELYSNWRKLKNKSNPKRAFFERITTSLMFISMLGLAIWFVMSRDTEYGIWGSFWRVTFICGIFITAAYLSGIFLILLAPILVIVLPLFPILSILLLLLQAGIYMITEIFLFKPILYYFYLSSREKLFKLSSFVLIAVGFMFNLLCS